MARMTGPHVYVAFIHSVGLSTLSLRAGIWQYAETQGGKITSKELYHQEIALLFKYQALLHVLATAL